ncbi:MAG: putative glycoside hydrolase family 15 protein [Pseudomonadota bacterium]|nr:putative glycoside hydrolase family 15 protein [Pseudomonadota bacterium]
MFRKFGLTLLLASAVSGTCFGLDNPPFPRIAANDIGSPQNYEDPTVQAQLARFNFALINIWPGWSGGHGGVSIQQVVQNITALNPNSLVFIYTDVNELGDADNSGSDVWSVERNKLNSMGWWLYPNGGGGTRVKSTWGTNYYTINTTSFVPVDSNGYHFTDWMAHYLVSTFYAPNPALAGIYTDNVPYLPFVDGDWNRDGTTDSKDNTTVATWDRLGYQNLFKVERSLLPSGKYLIGNLSNFGNPAAVFPELQGQLNGGFMEGLIGYSWSVETWSGWTQMMAAYRKIMGAIAAPKLAMFAQIGSPTDYQSVRYGLASCLMDDGYFTFNSTSGYSDMPWFDEFNAALGQSTSAPATTAWQKGVYRRDFANGIALVNPKGNGTQTVTLEADFRHLSGTQAPAINNGQTTRTVTLNDRDGILLLRTTAPATVTQKPNAPANVIVQ